MNHTSARWAAAAVCGVALLLQSCSSGPGSSEFADDLDALSPDSVVTGAGAPDSTGFVWQTEQFADIKMIRYQVPGWDKLTPRQQALVYCLNQAGLSGRDMIWDQNNRYNLAIRDVLEAIYTGYAGDKATKGWHRFETYVKRVWFSNGIHHHYANTKILPEFTRAYFAKIAQEAGVEVSDELVEVIFDPAIEAKRVELDATKGLCESSSVNFYAPDVTTEEAQAFYAARVDPNDRTPIEHGLNSRLVKGPDGKVMEDVYKVGGLYGSALEQVVYWLNEALKYTENDRQASALRHLIAYYETGDLEKWKLFNINWVQDTEGVVDYIHGFVEVYNDPLGHKGTFESIVQIKDFDASERMKMLMENAQWFEDHMPFLPAHKKKNVVGITYNVVNVAGEAGDASPSTPIGVNLPNSNWIRVLHGSKSVSLGNITEAYDRAGGSGLLQEFAHDAEEVALAEAHGDLAGKLHTAMHEVIGHASGQIEPGVGETKETLKEYASTIEEGRADLVALYFMLDPKMVELGLMSTLDVGRAEYDSYLRNGLFVQLRRLEPGANIEEAHMRNRSWVSRWVMERAGDAVATVERDGKTFVDIRDYNRLRVLFGELLGEVQRIKSQGDYAAAKALVESYGVKVDADLHAQVLKRSEALGIAPYGGFINPRMEAERDATGAITKVSLTYPDSFAGQMLDYAKNYHFLTPEKK